MLSWTRRRRRLTAAAILTATALAVGACATEEQAKTPAQTKNEHYEAAVAEAKRIAEGQDLDSSLEMLGNNTGEEGQLLENLYSAFTAGAGTEIRYSASQDASTVLQARLDAGNPPDVAEIMLGMALGLAKQDKLTDLSKAVGQDVLAREFDQSLLDAASHEGKIFGVFQGFNNFVLWHNPKAYQGPKAPTSWDQITEWTKAEADKGNPVWCMAQEVGASSGFPAAQLVENLFLKKYGPELNRQWGEGKLAWTSPEVKDAFQQLAALIDGGKAVDGGILGSLSAPIATGYNGLVADPPACQLVLWGTWVPGLIGETAKPGENIDFYRVPAIDPAYAKSEMFQATPVVAFRETPTVKAFLTWLASTPAQAYLASMDHWPVANKNVASSTYQSVVLRQVSEQFFGTSGTALAVGPNVLLEPATQMAFWGGMTAFLQDPSDLDQILEGIQATVGR